MSSEKITVDEPLISTDVDKLIRTVADKKKVSLLELRELCRIDKKTLDKWITVLEDTGYVTVKYALGNTFIIWSGSDAVGTSIDAAKSASSDTVDNESTNTSSDSTSVTADTPITADTTLIDSSTLDVPKPDTEPAPEPEAPSSSLSELMKGDAKKEMQDAPLLSEEIEKRVHTTGSDDETAIDSLKYGILTKLKEGDDEQAKADLAIETAKEEPVQVLSETATAEPAKIETSKSETSKPEPVVAESELESETTGSESESVSPAPSEAEGSVPVASDSAKKSLNEYIEAIKAEKAHLAQLEAEKERVYAERIATLEGKMDSDISALTQAILEKEQKLLDLKDGFLEMPDKIEDIEKIQVQLERIRSEGKESLEAARKKSEQLLGHINDTRADVRGKIDKLDSLIRDEDSKVGQLERLDASLQAKVEKLTTAIAEAKAQMDDLNRVMTELSDDLDQTRNMKAKVKDVSADLKETIAQQGTELHSLETEVSAISEVERLVNAYLSEYEKKLQDIESYVAKSDDEIAGLRASAESAYLKKYLGELENTADAYEAELDSALAEEQDIETRINEAKSKISSMIRSSRSLVKRLHGETSSLDFETARSAARSRAAGVKQLIAAKAAERVRILAESKQARKSSALHSAVISADSAPVSSKSSSKKRKKKE